MKQYKHIFFDLDKTLWDFTGNTIDTFHDLYNNFSLKEKGISDYMTFYENYEIINDKLWRQYRNGNIEKNFLNVQRFYLALLHFSVDDMQLARAMASDYLRLSPLKTLLIPDTHETLQYLHAKYQLHIITNGFKEVQSVKVERSDIKKYFKEIITSEEAGCHKPAKEIFDYSLRKTGAVPDESLVIGDDIEVDIKGAFNAGIDQVYVNLLNEPNNFPATFQVSSLKYLMCFL